MIGVLLSSTSSEYNEGLFEKLSVLLTCVFLFLSHGGEVLPTVLSNEKVE